MTNLEFDTQFDIFYNNIASNAAPSVNSYEKSVFLTQAQRDVIINLYNGREVPGLSFESTEESRRYLSNLVKEKEIVITDKNALIELPKDLWFITLEECSFNDINLGCKFKDSVEVIPARQDYLHSILKNPFKGPSPNRVIRVDIDGKIKLYSKYNLSSYKVTYVERPKPIILEDLDSYDLTIEGLSKESESNVNPVLHRAILEKAVSLAKAAYIGN